MNKITVYAFISERFLSGNIVCLLSDHGHIVSKFDAWTYESAKKFALSEKSIRDTKKIYPDAEVVIQWVDSPYNSPSVKDAMREYESLNGVAFNGRVEWSQNGAELPRFG